MTQYYSRTDINYAGDSNFTIPFSYISKDDVHVYVNDAEITTFIWNNDSQIQITSTLTTGDVISIRRETPIDEKIVTYQNMSMVLSDDNLNKSQDQVLNAVQEIYDSNTTFKIIVDNDITGIDAKVDTAVSTANGAVTTANSANSKADSAVSTANTANSKADNAVSTANTASSNASTAVSTANTAKNTADTASETATSASNKVDEFGEDIEAVIEAAEKIDELEEAVQTAVDAASTASDKADIASNKATEATNAANRAEAVIPSQTGNNGKFLQTNGTAASWQSVDALPTQTGNNGKFLQTNGTATSWQTIPDALPSQSGQSGKYLTTDGTNASWASVDSLPSQTGQSGKFLTTDGTDASWANVDALPSQTGHSGEYLTTDGTDTSWSAISGANTDLSNLTSTGKTKVVTLAHEFDWANVVTVATGNKGNTYISYTFPSDGMLYVYAKGGGTSSNAKFTYAVITNSGQSMTYDSQMFAFGGAVGVSNSTAVAKYCGKSGEQVAYMCYVSGYTTLTGAEVTFIPFKKS